MSRKPESDGIPAEVVIAKLEAKLQAALDKRGLRRCQYCRLGILKPDVRDVVITREERSTIVRNIRGRFCDQCGQIEFDETTDSASRYAVAVNSVSSIMVNKLDILSGLDEIQLCTGYQVDGVPGINSPSERSGGGGGASDGGSNDGNMTDRVVNSAMKYRTQVAFVDGLMKDLGLPINSLGSAGGMSFRNFAEPEKQVDGKPPAPRKKSKDDD